MRFDNFTDQDRVDLKELLSNPLNYPNYFTHEGIRRTFHILIGGTIFQIVLFLLFMLMSDYKAGLILVVWLIFVGGYTVLYKVKRMQNKKLLFKMVDERFQAGTGLEFKFGEDFWSVGSDKYPYSEVKHIIMYRNVHFICLTSRIIVAANGEMTANEIKKLYKKYYDAEIIETEKPFSIREYVFVEENKSPVF